jgi:hypothetical protein
MLVASLARWSPLFYRFEALEEATARERVYLARLAEQIEAADAGTVIRVVGVPYLLPYRAERPHLGGVAILGTYSVAAWARLVFPDRPIRVAYGRHGDASPDEGGVVLVLGQLARAAQNRRGPSPLESRAQGM